MWFTADHSPPQTTEEASCIDASNAVPVLIWHDIQSVSCNRMHIQPNSRVHFRQTHISSTAWVIFLLTPQILAVVS